MRRLFRFSALIWLPGLLLGLYAFAGVHHTVRHFKRSNGPVPIGHLLQPSGTPEPANTMFSGSILPASDTINGGSQLKLVWSKSGTAQEYDVEWTTADSGNLYIDTIRQMANGTAGAISSNLLNQVFLHNATRITTTDTTYLVSLVSNDNYVVARIRQVSYTSAGIRVQGAWDYSKGSGHYAAWALVWHQQNLNWQYSAAYAEGGKKKEVVSYFDGTLRGRQTVTINNSDKVDVIQENVYDEFGRAVASILPAPSHDATGNTAYLRYFKNYNLNSSNAPYNSDNVEGSGDPACEFLPDTLPETTGASLYYSHSNLFLNPLSANYARYNNFIPDAERYPLSVTEYTADNTGRIKIQGGVGKTFQPGVNSPSKTTKYYYGKPEQWELDQLFGNDAGYASHYLKNMVVDPNGQISISYINASGKTVATALTGIAPASMDSLVSSVPVTNQTINLLDSSKFVFNPSALTISATSTYLASVSGTAKLKYNIQKLIDKYPGGADSICSNCYYDLTIKVYDDCKDSIYATSTPVPIGALSPDCSNHGLQTDSVSVTFPQIGEYYVTFALAFSKTVMENYTDNFVTQGQASGAVKTEFDFILPYLDSLNLKPCLSDCTTNEQTLGTEPHFTQAVKNKLLALDVDSASLSGTAFTTWVSGEYTSLKAYVDSTQATCSSAIASSPCQQYLQPMENDVSPGGQYALFDANNNALDLPNNVISQNWRTVFPELPKTDTLYNTALVTLPDGTITSVYDSTFTLKLLVQYWQPAWADQFLSFHPEYCKLQFCQNNVSYELWDQTVQDSILTASQIPSIPGAPGGFHYDYTNGAWLLPADPFFKTGAPGASLATAFQTDLQNYSRNALMNNVGSVKNLVQLVDFLIYCADPNVNVNTGNNTYNNWDNCTPAAACRVPDREWSLYKDFYFQLKQQYYNKVRLNTICKNTCTVGTPESLPTASACPVVSDFTVNDYSTADGTPTDSCASPKKLVTLAYTQGNVAANATVTISYAQGTDTTGLPKTFTFAKGDRNKMFCVPDSLPAQSISVQSVVCDSCGVNPLVYNTWQNDLIIQNTYTGGTITARDTLHIDSESYFKGMLTIKPGNTYDIVDSLHTYSGSWQLSDSCQFSLFGNNNVKYLLDSVSANNMTLHYRLGNIDELWHYNALGSTITCASPDTIHVTALQTGNAYFKGVYPTRHLITVIAGPSGTAPPFTCVNSSGGDTTSTSAFHACFSVYTPYSTIKFQNVWVFDCVYDNVPPGCSPELLTKQSVFHDTFTNPVATDTATTVQQTQAQLTAQVQNSCEANAANWMTALDSGLVGHSADTLALKNEFLAICAAGGDINHPFGASTVPPGVAGPGGYTNFGDAIKGILHLSTFTTKLNPWLISMPFPYTPQMQGAYKTIASSNADICTLLTTLQANCTAYNTAHGTSLTLYQYLVLIYGSAMILSSDDLTALQNSCGTCKYILNDDITLPVFLDPTTKGCIVPADYTTAKSSLIAEFGGSLDTTDVRYQTIFANYMNQRWGFILSYDQYKDYEATLVSNPSAVLCNQIVSEAPPIDTLACIEAQLAVGVANGKTVYNAYIETEKNLFRASYVSTCSAASTNVNLTAPQKIYHYTLYYYDQADNLVRTVPPEGVTLLASSSFAQVDTARNRADTSLAVYPQHKIPTYYAYNSTNQVSTQQSPDGGTNRFWYDLLSRLNISENDKQNPTHDYSYTKYDSIGRITEVGQKRQNTINIDLPDYLDNSKIDSFNNAGTNSQITNTYYDTVVNAANGIQKVGQSNIAMRKRVSLTTYRATQTDTVTQATYYDYDLDGNVKNLYQQVQGLGIKRINYEYDLISGKVNFVAYQNSKPDQFYYQYNYDADNRLTEAWTSIKADTSTYGIGSKLDPTTQRLDASYQYYLHGPLARMELGNTGNKVQGVDYAYTLQGWIKGVNSQNLNPSQDMGLDSATVAKDAYGYSLGYYTNDYKPIGGSSFTAFADQYTQNSGDITGQSLYNGNISTATYAISAISSGAPVGYTYHYDQLNRIKHLRQHSGISSWSNSNINSGYSEDFTFDGNGNILSLLRSGTTSATKDSLLYQYNLSGGRLVNNKLNWLNGHGAATNMGTDQSANNYKYDPIGNLTDDAQSHIDSIHWSVYGKITDMLDSTKTIAYKYNTAQERIAKTANSLTTYYVRDAQGNPLAVYDNKLSQVNWREQHLYGSSRLGMWQPNVNLATNNAATVWDTIGHKQYELVNHLGNVIVTIKDSRTSHTGFFTPDVSTAQDYYAFGALMPSRTFTASFNYRYGFNGKENDNEVKGVGNQQDYGMRIYDPRTGRFLSTDPLQISFPWNSPYVFSEDRVLDGIDLDGKEFRKSPGMFIALSSNGFVPQLEKANSSGIYTDIKLKYIPEFYKNMGVKDMEGFAKQTENLSVQKSRVTSADPLPKNSEDAKDAAVGIGMDLILEDTYQYKALDEVHEQLVPFNQAIDLVAAAKEQGLFPKQFQNDLKFQADLINFTFDGSHAFGQGEKGEAYNNIISILGKELYYNRDAISNGNYKRAPTSITGFRPSWGLDQPSLAKPIYMYKFGEDKLKEAVKSFNNATQGTIDSTISNGGNQ